MLRIFRALGDFFYEVMKHTITTFLTLIFVSVLSCSKENEERHYEIVTSQFSATTESYSPITKTSLDPYGNVLWKSGDQVSIFVASTINELYQVSDNSNGKTSATLNKVGSPGFVAGSELPANIAYYPYSSSNEIAKNGIGYSLTVNLPSIQTYAEGSFGNGVFPMVSVTNGVSDFNLKFKNVLGGLKLRLKGTARISSIVVSGNNDEILCGSAVVSASSTSTPSIVLSDDTKTQVTLDCGSGVLLNTETAVTFIIALPPITMTNGFTIDIYDTQGGSQQIKTTRTQTITRSALLAMPEVSVSIPHTYVDLGLSVKWATCNVGATSPEEYGDYFAWGEIETKALFTQESYRFWDCGVSGCGLTKYNKNSDWGEVDNKNKLDIEDDVAHIQWGGDWRLPTFEECQELTSSINCTWTWTTMNGINGYIVTSKVSGYEGNYIFLPASGFICDDNETVVYDENVGDFGYYWASELSTYFDISYMPQTLNITLLDYPADTHFHDAGPLPERIWGCSARPVCP